MLLRLRYDGEEDLVREVIEEQRRKRLQAIEDELQQPPFEFVIGSDEKIVVADDNMAKHSTLPRLTTTFDRYQRPIAQVPVERMPVAHMPPQQQMFPQQQGPLQPMHMQQLPLQQVPYQQVHAQQMPGQQLPPQLVVQEMPTLDMPIAEMPAHEISTIQELPSSDVPVELMSTEPPPKDGDESNEAQGPTTTISKGNLLEVPAEDSEGHDVENDPSTPRSSSIRRASSVYTPQRQSVPPRRSSSVYTTSRSVKSAGRPNSMLAPFSDVAWNPPRASVSDEPIERSLTKAIAAVLGLTGEEVLRDESFTDLGGDQRTAKELRSTCKEFGLSVRSKDIMNCKTLAELETKITPLTTSPPLMAKSPYAVSPLTLKSTTQPGYTAKPEDAETPVRWSMVDDGGILRAPTIKHAPSIRHTPSVKEASPQPSLSTRQSPSIRHAPSVKEVISVQQASFIQRAPTHGRAASIESVKKSPTCPRLKPKSSKRYHNKVEQVLSLNGDVSKAAVLKPKAGLFDGQPVAFVTLTSCVVEAQQDAEVKLLDASYYNSQLPAIRKAVEAKVSAASVPKLWCLIERMPLDEFGRVSRRSLQTWIQNINEELRGRIMSPELDQEETTQPKTPTQRKLQRAVSKVFDVEQKSVGMNTSFSKLGGDSAKAEQLMVRSQTQGLSLKAEDILQADSLAQLASLATENDAQPELLAENVGEDFELSPMQRLYFHSTLGSRAEARANSNGDYRFNQSVMFHFKTPTNVEDVRAAVETIVGHHPMLRTLFHSREDSWSQRTLTDIPSSYHFEQFEVSNDTEVEEAIARTQSAINIENGPVFSAQYFKMNDGHQMLHLVAHHLVVDLKSWRIIADDLDGLLTDGSLVSGRGLSFQDWSSQQTARMQQNKARKGFPKAAAAAPGNVDYWGVDAASNSYGNLTKASFSLGAETTSMLAEGNKIFRSDSADIFMAGLLLSFCQTFKDRSPPAIWNQDHERTTLDSKTDISEAVGWFTSLYPLTLSTSSSDDFSKALYDVKDSRRAMQQRGAPSFASSLIDSSSAEKFTSNFLPLEVLFTYAGSMQNLNRDKSSLEQIPIPGCSLASKTSDIGNGVGRIALFEVSVAIEEDEARVKFLYHRETKHQALILSWIKTYEELLRKSIAQLQRQSPKLSRADMPLLDLSYEKLHTLNKEILPSLNIDISDVETIYPISRVQQNILINESLVPGSGRIQAIYELTTLGSYIDVSRLCAAWQQVSRQYAALRTVFVESPSQNELYDQIILKRHSPNMLFIEATHGDGAFSALKQLAALSVSKGTPAHRLVVCQAPGKTLLKMEISQALCDATSISLLFESLNEAYFSDASLVTYEISYPEYLEAVKTTSTDVEFWKSLLADVEPCHIPSVYGKTPEPKEFDFTSIELSIQHQQLEEFAAAYTIEVAAVLRVAWALVLRAYVGMDSVCFGYQTSGRDVPVDGMEQAVGSFAAILPCNLTVAASEHIAQLLLTSEERHHDALDYQHVPVSSIYHALGVKSDDSLFNTCLSFAYEDVPTSTATSKFRLMKSMHAYEYDMSIDCDFKDGKVVLQVAQRILNNEQVENIAHAFGRAIQSIVEAPRGTVKDVDLFTEHDHKMVLSWNSSPRLEYSKEFVHGLITKHAAQNPSIQAVCAWDGELTYGELDTLSTTLSSYLLDSGLTNGSPIPVIADKSRWAVVAMLAVMKAGAVLVPVDAEATSMIPWIIKSVGATSVMASESVRSLLDLLDVEVFYLNDAAFGYMIQNPIVPTAPKQDPVDLSVILFKYGGSKDKGISYSHGALATACIGQGPALLMNPSSRVMQLSSFGVDIALAEVFTTLVHGGCVCVPSHTERIEGFTQAAQRMNVNWTYLTPTLSRRLQPSHLPDIAVVCFRTRQLDEDTFGPWVGKAKVLLAYGSAEACPLGLSASEVKDSSTVKCIGVPFAGNFWIVNPDDSNKLMPVGSVGELVIGAPTLASPYKAKGLDPNDSKKKLVRAESDPNQSSKLLKTGHMVRYREGGVIELVSTEGEKTDIDGRTFKPVEVEPLLRRCLGRGLDVVVETIAFNYHEGDSAPILAAFIELGEDLFDGDQNLKKLSLTTKERLYRAKELALRALKDNLPRQMVPSAFIPVKKMPMTPSLKVSRRELQKMIMGLSKPQLLGLADVPNPHKVTATLNPLPLTPVEKRVRAICAAVLAHEESTITAEDTFTGLGGDAVSAQTFVTACKQDGVAISMVDVLRNMSISELCRGVTIAEPPAVVAEQNQLMNAIPSNSFIQDTIAPQIGFEKDTIEDIAEATAMQTMFIESGMLKTKGNINYFMINVSGGLDWGKLENACFLLTQAHPILRTVFASANRQLYQTVLRSFHPDFKRFQCPSWRLGNLATKLIKRDQAMPVDFRSPITKFSFLDAGKSSILMLRLSRAQYNDISLPTLLRDLCHLYDHGEIKTIRSGFCSVVRVAQHFSQGASAEYWKALLEGSTMTQVMDQPTPVAATGDSKTIHQQIPTGSAQLHGIPFETVLKGAWSVVLSNLSGSDDVVFGQLIEGKHLSLPNGTPISEVVGPSGNIIPVRTKLPDFPVAPFDYFRVIQSQHVASIPHENMQFGDIVTNCTSWPSWTRFSTVVQHQNQGDGVDLGQLVMGGASCKLSTIDSNHQNSDIFVRSVANGPAHINVSVSFCDKRIDPIFADAMLKMLCSTISLLTSAFMMDSLKLKGLNDSNEVARIPLPNSDLAALPSTAVSTVLPDHASAIHTIISTAWDTIMQAYTVRAADVRSVPFYEVWGSLVPAAELARYYTEKLPYLRLPGLENVEFSTEDVLENPTMMKQYEMIIAKQQGQQQPQPGRRTAALINRPSSAFRQFSKLATSGGGGSGGAAPTPTSTPPPQRVQHVKNAASSGGDSGMESMTTGSSNSDSDELRDEVIGGPVKITPKKKTGTGLSSLDGRVLKSKASTVFGKIKALPGSKVDV